MSRPPREITPRRCKNLCRHRSAFTVRKESDATRSCHTLHPQLLMEVLMSVTSRRKRGSMIFVRVWTAISDLWSHTEILMPFGPNGRSPYASPILMTQVSWMLGLGTLPSSSCCLFGLCPATMVARGHSSQVSSRPRPSRGSKYVTVILALVDTTVIYQASHLYEACLGGNEPAERKLHGPYQRRATANDHVQSTTISVRPVALRISSFNA